MIRKAIIISISGPFLTIKEMSILRKDKPWGIILFKRNILSENQLINLTKKIRKIMKDKKFPILIDEEGGRVSRLSNFLNNSINNQKYFGNLYKSNKYFGTQFYKLYINSISKILIKTGININTSPVLDLIKKNTHSIIGDRSYSRNPKIVNELGRLCVEFYKANKIATVIKHIPGHGSANLDSHFNLPKVNNSLKSLKNYDFKCFKNTSSFFAMTAHILYSKIDKKNNVTHSNTVIKKIIREEIGFKGILISDDISMKALKYNLKKNAKLALDAGCNLVLYCAGKSKEMSKLIKEMPYIDKFTAKKTSEFYKFLS
ncbi:glycoside hydrolase family 3 protein [Pelagibacteraceae bacterium]|nr:glycoside hydrolase family 3 protein [Pelagibacteraceae bacterium]